MTRKSVREYVEAVRGRYAAARKGERGRMLNEFCVVTGYARKSAIRVLRRALAGAGDRRDRRGRPPRYGPQVVQALVRVWEAAGRICGKRLAPFMKVLVPALERHGELRLEAGVRYELLGMSAATMDRRLARERQLRGKQPVTQTRALSCVQAQVPVRTFGEWQGVRPGWCQADLVAHCGETTQGIYVATLTVVDVATSWTALQAVWGVGGRAVQGGLHRIRQRLPMGLWHLHSDNGAEFLNQTLVPYCEREGIRMSRGRPYKKNDQAFVEQKNGAVVRQVVGYARYDDRATLQLLGEVYEHLELWVNHFQPVQRVVDKVRVGAKVRKRYDEPRTPYQRLLESGVLSPEQTARLTDTYRQLNPLELRRRIDTGVRRLWKAAGRDHSGVMIPRFVPTSAAREVGGEDGLCTTARAVDGDGDLCPASAGQPLA